MDKKIKPILSVIAIVLLAVGYLFYNNDAPIGEEKTTEATRAEIRFRNDKLLEEHYEKHGVSMGFDTAEDYEQAACYVVTNKSALHKTESEDGDDVYYLEDTNEFVIVSTDGYIRTYFMPEDGIDYFKRQ